MSLKLVFSFLFFFILTTGIFAQQSKDSIKIDEPYLFDQYQIFLEEEIMHLIMLEYENENKEIDGYLNKEEKIIILNNYDGKNRVKVSFLDFSGNLKSFTKSKCVIDPYSPL